jgi:hypothetical protein
VRLRFTVGIVFLSSIIFISSFLTWGTFQVSFNPGSITTQYFPYIGNKPTVVLDGWSESLRLFGVNIPNYVIPACAGFLVLLTVLRALSIFDRHALLSVAIAFYGILHTGHVVYVLSRGGTLGPGSVMSAVLFVLIIVLLLKEMRQRRMNDRAHVR